MSNQHKNTMRYVYHKESNEDIHIDDNRVLIGKNENLLCYCCQSPVIAKSKKSTKQISHFAHPIKIDKEQEAILHKQYLETRNHKLGKDIVAEKSIFSINVEDKIRITEDLNEETIKPSSSFFSFSIDISKSIKEQKRNDIIPDVTLISGENEYYVEIKVTHKVDEHKREKIIKQDVTCIEIDLSKIDKEISIEEMKEVINDLKNHQIIYLSSFDKEKYYTQIENKYKQLLNTRNFQIINEREKIIKYSSLNTHEIYNAKNNQNGFCLFCNRKVFSQNGGYGYHYKHLYKNDECLVFQKNKKCKDIILNHIFLLLLGENYKNEKSIAIGDVIFDVENYNILNIETIMLNLKDIDRAVIIKSKYKGSDINDTDLYIKLEEYGFLYKQYIDIKNQPNKLYINSRFKQYIETEISSIKSNNNSKRNIKFNQKFYQTINKIKLEYPLLNIENSCNCFFCGANEHHSKNCIFYCGDIKLHSIIRNHLQSIYYLTIALTLLVNQEISIYKAIEHQQPPNLNFYEKDEFENWTLYKYQYDIPSKSIELTIALASGELKKIIFTTERYTHHFQNRNIDFYFFLEAPNSISKSQITQETFNKVLRIV